MFVFSNVIKPQGLEPLQFPTKFRSHSDPVEAMSVVVAQQTVLEQLQVRLWTTILDQQLRRRQLGVMYEPGLQELDEDTLRELRTLGYIR